MNTHHIQSNFKNYKKEGDTWDKEIFANLSRSRNRAWLFCSLSMAIAVISLSCLALLLPLKTFEPYVVTVDRSTGYVEMARGLYAGDLSEDEAITQSNLVRYLTAREAYNPNQAVLKDNYNFVSLLSDKAALTEYQQLWDAGNSENPSIKLGKKASVDIRIQSVAFLNEKTAAVRFVKEERHENLLKKSAWNAIIAFQYVQKPMKMLERFSNPLGFQVTSYRLNPEITEIEK